MSITLDRSLQILEDLGKRPAISFHETLISDYVLDSLNEMGVETRRDPYGNIIALIIGMTAGVPPLAFVAHMDHPGFEPIELQGNTIIAEARGGVPLSSFSDSIAVEAIAADGKRFKAELAGSHGDPAKRQVIVKLQDDPEVLLPSSIVFELPDFKRDGDFIRMRAADDLAGCAAILSVMQDLAVNPALGDVYGVFTRAEEVGLIGARVMAQEHSLPLDTLVVSLESSRELPGAVIGSGPVIRVGDVTFTFSSEGEQVLHVAKQALIASDPDYKVQRQLMSGGTCEASGFAAWGYATTGIAFPLGNYHNATPEGEVDAEYIHVEDFWGGVRLIRQAADSVAARYSSPSWTRLQAVSPDLQQRLVETCPN